MLAVGDCMHVLLVALALHRSTASLTSLIVVELIDTDSGPLGSGMQVTPFRRFGKRTDKEASFISH